MFKEQILLIFTHFFVQFWRTTLQKLVIPSQQYVKFTTSPAPMPDIIVNAWKEIWDMSPKELGGKRCYKTDFEIYDERAADHQNIVLDVYIGIEPLIEAV